jgi:HEPN domain-containing protein
MRSEINRWFLQSKEEFETAKASYQAKKWFAVAFWCQQAVEKALKAMYMVKKKKSPGTTHSLTFLGRELNLPQKYQNFLRELTKEYYMSRYPDASEDVPFKLYSEQEVEKYLKECEELISWLESAIKK